MKSLCAKAGDQEGTVTADKIWDIKNLKLEVNRVYMRTFKKVGKANERLAKALVEYNEVLLSICSQELRKSYSSF